jgi:hypothetical protein
VAIRPPWNRGWRFDQTLVAVRTPGPALAARNNFFNEIFSKEFQRFKIIPSKERNSGGILTRIRNLSIVATID